VLEDWELEHPGYDYYFIQTGNIQYLVVANPETCMKIAKEMPSKIDRD
jgi:hypothetical protein